MRAIVLSPPGAGKGTQCALLSSTLGVAHISSGDILRVEIAQGTALGRRVESYTARGDLVPDEVVFDILVPAVTAAAAETGGYLLDGFPRTLPQALRAAELGIHFGLSSDVAIYLTAPSEVLIERLMLRAEQEGRSDDSAEIIRHRLSVFEKQTRPLVRYYRTRGILLEVDADRPVDVVATDLATQLGVTTP